MDVYKGGVDLVPPKTMHRFSVLSVIILAIVSASCDVIPEGGLCSGISGPVGVSEPGTICCYTSPDQALCFLGKKCPLHFTPPGGLCSSIAGPSKYPCWPGTHCCPLGPDRSVCTEGSCSTV
ncbi:hypothetical protein AMATHDRAFT_86349 [Amanita thiersii Skay4041]|uniref:Granulins domain-containing protein n=1 Tax=Amanita thiersii Skay4041 TaxID=703135 RepID=A0A2A9NEX5_9AGAR|nr:hypothetical protein AMATHDRAFT_86349 [Amanita thiersii Skay4041]